MIRNEAIQSLEEWEGKDIVLSFAVPGVGIQMERVQLILVESSFLLCRDTHRRDQVYGTNLLIGWEPYDAISQQSLEDQNQVGVLQGAASPSPKEDKGVRKVGPVRKVIQPGGFGGIVKVK